MNLDITAWKEFSLEEIFTINGTKITKIDVLNEYGTGEYHYVTTQSTDNAVSGYYDFYAEKGNVLTIDSAVTGFCSYQAKNFSTSDHVEKLTSKFDVNKHIALFLTTIINLERYKYSYGRKCNQIKIRGMVIKLPNTTNAKTAKHGGMARIFIRGFVHIPQREKTNKRRYDRWANQFFGRYQRKQRYSPKD
jgi:hypothetical protein